MCIYVYVYIVWNICVYIHMAVSRLLGSEEKCKDRPPLICTPTLQPPRVRRFSFVI